MRVILKPRQGGKTYDMIHLSAILNVPILTADSTRARFVESMAHTMGVLIPKPISAESLRARRWRGDIYVIPKDVVVDDADAVLRVLFNDVGVNPVAMAMTQNVFE